MTTKKNNFHKQTLAIHGGIVRSQHGETSEALFLSSGFCYPRAEIAEARFNNEEEGYLYSRFSNPTVNMFEKRIALIEGAEAAKATSSGMSAVFNALMSNLQKGDHVVSGTVMFSSCRHIIETILPQFGVESTLIDATLVDEWKKAIRPNTKVLFIETPANPNLPLGDIRAISDIAHENGAILVVDNAMVSPIAQLPLEFGADIVIYSATKHIDGQGRSLAGVILGKQDYINDQLFLFHKHTGANLGAFDAWILLKSLETLSIRVERQCKNAMSVARMLEEHAKIEKIVYPGLPSHPQYELAKKQMILPGSMVGFYLKADKKNSFAFMNALKLILISNNLGDVKSLITHPFTTTHQGFDIQEKQKANITPNLMRLSVGMEYTDDIIYDLEQALAKIHN